MCDAELGAGAGAAAGGAVWVAPLCALVASAVRGITGFADGLTFQALWALAMACGVVPSSCAAIRKGVLYSTIMQLITLPIQAWATRHHLGLIKGYLLAMCALGSCTVYVGAWLLLQDFALQLRLFAGAFFCLVAGAQLSLSARAWLDARASAALAADAAAAAKAPAAEEPTPAALGDASTIVADWTPTSAEAAAAGDHAAFAGPSNAGGAAADAESDGNQLVPARAEEPPPLPSPPPSPSPLPPSLPPAASEAPTLASSKSAAAQWLTSPAGQAWLPSLSPVLSPLPLLGVLGGASLCAGVLNGMLGAGGPPLMLAYSFLELDKDVLRGLGVVPSVFMVLRLGLYVVAPNGIFDPAGEAATYALIAAASAGGSAAGGRLRASCSATALLRAILALVWLSGWSMLGAFVDSLPAGLFGSVTIAWLVLFGAAARWPRGFAAVRKRLAGAARA